MTPLWLGQLYTEKKDYNTALQYYKTGISKWEDSGLLPSWRNTASLLATRAKVLNHDLPINLNEQFELYSNITVKFLEGLKAKTIAEILLNIDDRHITDAEDWITKAIEADKRNGMRWQLALDYASYAEVLKRKGDQSKARETLSTSIDIFKECGADGWVEKYQKELENY